MEKIADAGAEMFMYLLFVGMTQGPLTAGVTVLGLPLAWWRGWRAYSGFAVRVLLFSLLLYLWGCLGSGFFGMFFLDVIYFNRDSVGDFVPWIPSTGYMVDTACGGHPINGATWNTLRLAWLAVAIPVWAATIWCYVKCVGYLRRPLPVPAAAR